MCHNIVAGYRRNVPPTHSPTSIQLHPTPQVTIRYKKNKTLGKWCNNMREQYKVYMKRLKAKEEGDESAQHARPKCPMTADRVRLLEEVGFQWSTDREGNFDVLWEKKLESLKVS